MYTYIYIYARQMGNPHREQHTIPQGQTSIPPESFSTPTYIYTIYVYMYKYEYMYVCNSLAHLLKHVHELLWLVDVEAALG